MGCGGGGVGGVGGTGATHKIGFFLVYSEKSI